METAIVTDEGDSHEHGQEAMLRPSVSSSEEDEAEETVQGSSRNRKVGSNDGASVGAGIDIGLREDTHGVHPLDAPVQLNTVTWLRQLVCAQRKNWLLVFRRPVMLTILLFSSVVSVVLAWLLARPSDNAIYGPVDKCGRIEVAYTRHFNYEWGKQDDIQITQNDRFWTGFAVALMALGPMVNAVIAFLLVHDEFASQLVGVLRALGLRDSVYWSSWYIVLVVLNTVNSFLATVTAKTLPLHAFENVYAAGIFASFFFLHLALVPSSFFLATLLGSAKRGVVWMVLIMLAAIWVTPIIIAAQSSWPWSASSVEFPKSPTGLFWLGQSTEQWYGYDLCHEPIVSEAQVDRFTTSRKERAAVTQDEYFLGCYFQASWHTTIWHPSQHTDRLLLGVYFMFPYFHFTGMWSNYIGFTSMSGNQFTSEQFGKSSEELAVEALPVPPNPDNGFFSKLAPQGSTFMLIEPKQAYTLYYADDDDFTYANNCPLIEQEDVTMCEYSSSCHGLKNKPTEDSPSSASSAVFLLINAIIYTLLSSYLAQTLPGSNGKAQPFYFFLVPSYWFGASRARQSDNENDVEAGSGAAGPSKIVLSNVEKNYGQFQAVKGVSMTMNRGEVTAFLGHNGAGKTTLSHIISCEIAASQGSVHVFGTSVADNPYAVRCMVGLCKQDDYLWPNLTAREHLELFAGLRGVASDDIGSTVQRWLESVDLATVQFQHTSSFSGGMKRRLSVALATIGERPLIILDEPTTGMDPVSRRFVWRHIDAIKEGRVIILTTHAMEEADLLADEVAIMRKGHMAAFGSPLQLKSEHGSALQFTLLVEREDVSEVQSYLTEFFYDSNDDVTVSAPPTGNIAVNIRQVHGGDGSSDGVSVDKLSSFVEWLDGDDSKVKEYGFSNSSLEEVFLRVTGEESTQEPESAPSSGPNAAGETEESEVAARANPDRLNEISSFKLRLTTPNQVRALFGFYMRRNWLGRSSLSNYIIYMILFAISLYTGLDANNGDSRAALTAPIVAVSLMLVGLAGVVYVDRSENLFYLMRTQGLLPQSFLIGITSYAVVVQLIFTLLVLTTFFFCPVFSSVKEVHRQDEYFSSSPAFGEQRELDYYGTTSIYYRDTNSTDYVDVRAYRDPGGYGGVVLLIVCFALSVPGSVLASSFLPGYKLPLVFVSFVCLIAGLAPMILYFVNKFSSADSWMDCVNDFLEYSDRPIVDGEEELEDAFCSSEFNETSLDEYFVNCVGFKVNSLDQFCIPAHVSLLPQFGLFQGLSMVYIDKITFHSDVPGYIENEFIPNISGAECSGSTCEFPYAARYYWKTVWFMLLGVVCLTVLGIICVAILAFPSTPVLRLRAYFVRVLEALMCKASDPQSSSSGHEKNGVVEDGAISKGDRVLDEVEEESEAVHDIVRPFLSFDHSDGKGAVVIDHNAYERDEITPVLAYKLCKTYPSLGGRPPKKALVDLDLHVPRGQCLGFLGKNGAGKTTALKILAGAHDPTSGLGLVAGYDVALERIAVFERLGNCPQFDVVWSTQSVQTHLEFFARLKGLPASRVKEVARAIAEAVGLGSEEVYARNAGALSGGMRRRLSIAMSLIGSPSVLILDEPTTGLDPSTRNNIWGLINSFNGQDRSTIITTHMMVEADTLCNRIAIIGDGRLKVIGTQQRLKDAYGSGYLLQLNLVRSDRKSQESAMSFVREHLHGEAELATRQAKTLHINLPRALDLRRVFVALYSPESKTEGGINQFLLSQSSLEDVFIALGD